MACVVKCLLSLLFWKHNRATFGEEKSSLAAFVVIFFLITVEVVMVKIVAVERDNHDDNYERRAIALFYEMEDHY